MPSDKVKILVGYDERLLEKPTKYALSILFEMAGVPFELVPFPLLSQARGDFPVVFSYGLDKPKGVKAKRHVHVWAGELFQPQKYLTRQALPRGLLFLEGIPVFFDSGRDGKLVERSEGRLTVGADIFASAFFLLTCYEEIVKGSVSETRGRFPARSSILGKFGLLHRPLVNEYAELLKKWIEEVSPGFPFVERSFRGRGYALVLTHDVDLLRVSPGYALFLLKRERMKRVPRNFLKLVSLKFRGREPFRNLREIVEWERKRNIYSSFYLMTVKGRFRANYSVGEIASLLKDAIAQGWEVGFHPDQEAALDERAFKIQLDKLKGIFGNKLKGGRCHFLVFSPPLTWRIWEKSGLCYDATLGFFDHEGFRCGICLPFRPFDVLEQRVMRIWEIPLTVMDCTLERYRGLSAEEAQEVVEKLWREVKKHKGVFVLLWHNTYFGEVGGGKFHGVFARLVDKALEEGAFVGPAKDVLPSTEGLVGS